VKRRNFDIQNQKTALLTISYYISHGRKSKLGASKYPMMRARLQFLDPVRWVGSVRFGSDSDSGAAASPFHIHIPLAQDSTNASFTFDQHMNFEG
jgi:hypothetical protein